MLGAVADGHALHYLGNLGLAFAGADVQVAERQFDILIDIEFVDEVETLEHESDVTLAEGGALLLLEAAHLGTEKLIAAAGRIVQQAEDVEKR